MYGKLNVTRRVGLVAVVAMAASLVLPGTASAEFKKVTVTAEGYNRRNAVNNALRKAVELAGGVKLTSMSKMENYQLVMDTVVATATGVVRTHRVVKESDTTCLANASCTVTVEAEVSDQNLYDSVEAARTLFQQKGRPSILVMISEQNAGAQSAEAWWAGGNKSVSMDLAENALIKRWQQYGFRFVDRQALMGKFRAASPTDPEVKEVAADAGADIVVIGKAVATKTDTSSLDLGDYFKNATAQSSLRILYVDTGEIIASSNGFGAAHHTNPQNAGKKAIERALYDASDEMFKGIMNRWQSETAGTQRLEVTATGFKKSKDFRKFMKTIQSKIDAVKEVNQRGYKSGSAKFEVMFTGSAFDFADALETQKFPGFGIELEEVTGNTLTFSVTQ